MAIPSQVNIMLMVLRYNTGRSQIAREIQQHHRNVLEKFRALNIRINKRAGQQSSADPVLEDSQKETVLVGID